MTVDLKSYDNSSYKPGSKFKLMLWYFVNVLIFQTGLFPINALKIFLLKIFGSRVGKGVVIKPYVNIKYPWFLSIGNYSWIGEKVWIDCLVEVRIGNNVNISQGAFLLTGSHDYTKKTFDFKADPIHLEDGSWIGAKAIVCPGVTCGMNSILTVGSITTKNLENGGVYYGNPARLVKERILD